MGTLLIYNQSSSSKRLRFKRTPPAVDFNKECSRKHPCDYHLQNLKHQNNDGSQLRYMATELSSTDHQTPKINKWATSGLLLTS